MGYVGTVMSKNVRNEWFQCSRGSAWVCEQDHLGRKDKDD